MEPTTGQQAEACQLGSETIARRFREECERESDINEHLPTLAELARSCTTVAEMGVRAVVSTWALLHGLQGASMQGASDPALAPKRRLICVDIEDPPEERFQQATSAAASVGVSVDLVKGDSAQISLPADVDLLFIDTWHVYGHLRRELQRHAPRVRKYIAMHDTEVDAELGESIRMQLDIEQQMEEYGYSRDEVTTGLQRAVEEFLAAHAGTWAVHRHYTNNNGLTVLKRLGTP